MGVNFNPNNFSNYKDYEQQASVVKTIYNKLPSDDTAIAILNNEQKATNKTTNPDLITELNEFATSEIRWEAANINEDYYKDYFAEIDWEAEGYEFVDDGTNEPYLIKENYDKDGTLISTDYLKAVDKVTDYDFIEGDHDAVEHMLIHTKIEKNSDKAQIDVMYAQDPNAYDANDWVSTKFAQNENANLKKYGITQQSPYKVINDRQLERTFYDEGKEMTYVTTINENGAIAYDQILREIDTKTNTTTSYTYSETGMYKTVVDAQNNVLKQAQVMYDKDGNSLDYDTVRNGVTLNYGIVGAFDNPSGQSGSFDLGTWTFEYDAQGKIISEHTSTGVEDSNNRIEYGYSQNGNLTSKTIAAQYFGEPTADNYKGFEETTLYDTQGEITGKNIVKRYDEFTEFFSFDKDNKGTYQKFDANNNPVALYNAYLNDEGVIVIEMPQ